MLPGKAAASGRMLDLPGMSNLATASYQPEI